MTETIMILAAGMSSRMKKSESDELNKSKIDEANKKSKSLISFGKDDKPFIYFLLDNIIKAGYKNLILVVGKDYSDFEQNINKYKGSNRLKISFAIQKIPSDELSLWNSRCSSSSHRSISTFKIRVILCLQQ